MGLDVSKDIQDKAKVHNFDKETFEEGENEYNHEFMVDWDYRMNECISNHLGHNFLQIHFWKPT